MHPTGVDTGAEKGHGHGVGWGVSYNPGASYGNMKEKPHWHLKSFHCRRDLRFHPGRSRFLRSHRSHGRLLNRKAIAAV